MLKKMLILIVAMVVCMFLSTSTFAATSGEEFSISETKKEKFFDLIEKLNYEGVALFLDVPSKDIEERMRLGMKGTLTREEKLKLKAECQAWFKLCKEGLDKLIKESDKWINRIFKESLMVGVAAVVAVYAQQFKTCAAILEE